MCWRLFVYGLDALSRRRAREALRMATAASMPYAKQDKATEWLDTQRIVAGW